MPNLTDYQRQHILDLLEQGQDLPLDYKHLLFPPERQEYELVYAGKEREEDILAETMAVPLQPVKAFGGNGADWHNMLIFGDNLQAMKTLLQWKEQGRLVNADGSRGVKLVYIDPPFATKQEFRGSQDERAYQDKVAGAQFVEFLRKRIVFLKSLLVYDGLLCIHLDYRKKHYIKVLLDEIFGEHCFRNEIVVNRIKKSIREREWVRKLNEEFDTILLYANGEEATLLPPTKRIKRSARWHAFDAAGLRTGMDYDLFGHKPPTGRHWMYSKERAEEMISTGTLRPNPRTGRPQYLIDASEEDLCNNLWTDISGYSFSMGYPTEKSEVLLERVIKMAGKPGDIVLDAFAGSGTTLAVAEKLGRRWIGIDCGKLAIYTIQKRMLSLREGIGNKGKALPPKPFTLYNAGLYDFSQLKRLPWEDWRFFALHLFQCRDDPHTVGGVELDGYRGADDVLVFNHLQHGGVVLDYGFIADLHNQVGGKVGARFFIIAPAASVTFLEDYIDKGRTRYYILRIPYSIINELHSRDFEAIIQPMDESQVNETVEAVGFDFVRLPEVACDYWIKPPEGQLISAAVVHIKTFKSKAMVKGATQKANLETLSMVMVDYDYDGEVFALDAVFYAGEIEKNGWQVRLPLESLGKQAMIIYTDIYGNEYREIKTPSDFEPVSVAALSIARSETDAQGTTNA
ncbi:MAG: site-specific DNA-methyltransferase [Anaerolineae bacterium]|nr:site-specific DNA-methyltransferase [Anaerolineae bacterium]